MHRAIIGAAGALALIGCGGQQNAENSAVADQDITAETVSGNDITAIDAATNDSANMAADAEVMLDEGNLSNEAEGNAAEGNSDS